jgi:aminoglycoside phosphotransferase family enzyme
MKKPVRYAFLDFSTLDARRSNCSEEVRLNRRLARNVYLGCVPLTSGPEGLTLDGRGEPVEWLVKMRRLPRHLMLDRAIAERRVSEREVVRFARVLAEFYRDSPPIECDAAAYCARLRAGIGENRQALETPAYELDAAALAAAAQSMLHFIDTHASTVLARTEHIVEGHGDLRPEHVCLAAEPVFIDCLEFNRELRIVDPVDELAYLAMECELLGDREVGNIAFETYESITHDAVDRVLAAFYKAQRALLRAKLAAWHTEDGLTNSGRARWLARARLYLALAQNYAREL